jgi:hypothetical protein
MWTYHHDDLRARGHAGIGDPRICRLPASVSRQDGHGRQSERFVNVEIGLDIIISTEDAMALRAMREGQPSLPEYLNQDD